MILTSFNEKGFEQYGRRFIETFVEHSNGNELCVFHDNIGDDFGKEYPQIRFENLYEKKGVFQVLQEMKKVEAFSGYMPVPRNKEPVYNWRFDAVKFVHKVLSIYHAYQIALEDNKDILIWLDADIEFTSDLPEKFEKLVLPNPFILSYLGRSTMHSECGFMAFRVPEISDFMNVYYGMYVTGAFSLAREWHDSFIFDLARLLALTGKGKTYSLSGNTDNLYPFDQSVLSEWMQHNKGPERKAANYG